MPIYLVGDPDQMLYRFAGAKPEILMNEIENYYPDAVTVKLETNYRSSRAIIETQLRLIEHNYERKCATCDGSGSTFSGPFPDDGMDDCPTCDGLCVRPESGPYERKYLKTLAPRPDAPDGEPVTFAEYESPEAEAATLVSNLIEAMANGSQPGSVFVGARTRAQLGYLEGPLTRAKIPFINIANPGGFWSSKHVQDVVAYLRLAFDEADDEAFKRVFNIASNYNTHPWGEHRGEYCHHRYLGKAFLSACQESYKNVWLAASKRRSFKPGVEDLTGLIQDIQAEMAMAESPAGVIRLIVDECYRRYLQAEEGITSDDEAENGKLDDFATVEDVAREFNNVEDFLGYVTDAKKAAEDAKDKSWDDYVVISTIHRLKGLERDVVYGVGLSEGFMAAGPAQIPAGLLPHTFSMTHPPNDGVLPTGGMGRIADERCIAFVLVSRARKQVHLSGVRQYRKAVLNRSRFVEEMGL